MPTPPLPIEADRPEAFYLAAFEAMEGVTLNGTHAGLRATRRDAMERFAALGFPTRKVEAWKYTDIAKVFAQPHHPASPHAAAPEDIDPYLIPGLDAHVVVLLNGRFQPTLSSSEALPGGMIVSSFASAAEENTDLFDKHFGRYADYTDAPLTALNTAFAQDGVFVYVPKGVVLEKTVHVLNLISGEDNVLVQPRSLFIVEEGASLRVVESTVGSSHAQTLSNSVIEIYVGRNANARYYQIQDAGDAASEVNTVHVYQEADSVFSTHTLTLSGGVVRNNLSILPDGEGCESNLYGLFLCSGKMHVDNHTLVDHARPSCNSNEMYKGVLDDTSSGVFNGKVLVRRDAQKTNAYQSNKSIVLVPTAKMYSKPELEIYADDVKCSHGATTGELDPEALFYLRSRGIPEQTARAMLLLAFAGDVVNTITLDPLREILDSVIHNRFAR